MDCVALAPPVLEWTPRSEHWQSSWHTTTNLYFTYFRESNRRPPKSGCEDVIEQGKPSSRGVESSATIVAGRDRETSGRGSQNLGRG
ncbi:MAG: hypothetical protein N2C14_02210 [Planctomycetales bacterium]